MRHQRVACVHHLGAAGSVGFVGSVGVIVDVSAGAEAAGAGVAVASGAGVVAAGAAGGVTTTGAGVTTAGAVSSFLPQAVSAAAAIRAAIRTVFFMEIPLRDWISVKKIIGPQAFKKMSMHQFGPLAYKPRVDAGKPGLPWRKHSSKSSLNAPRRSRSLPHTPRPRSVSMRCRNHVGVQIALGTTGAPATLQTRHSMM